MNLPKYLDFPKGAKFAYTGSEKRNTSWCHFNQNLEWVQKCKVPIIFTPHSSRLKSISVWPFGASVIPNVLPETVYPDHDSTVIGCFIPIVTFNILRGMSLATSRLLRALRSNPSSGHGRLSPRTNQIKLRNKVYTHFKFWIFVFPEKIGKKWSSISTKIWVYPILDSKTRFPLSNIA